MRLWWRSQIPPTPIKLDAALFDMNSSKQFTTQLSPYELVYGRTPAVIYDFKFPRVNQPSESAEEYLEKITKWRTVARQFIVRTQRKLKAYADLSRRENRTYYSGDLVLVARRKIHVGKPLLPKFLCFNSYCD